MCCAAQSVDSDHFLVLYEFSKDPHGVSVREQPNVETIRLRTYLHSRQTFFVTSTKGPTMTTSPEANLSINNSIRMGSCLVGVQETADPLLWFSAYRTFTGQNVVSNRDVVEWFTSISEQAKKAATLAATLSTNSVEDLQVAMDTINAVLSS